MEKKKNNCLNFLKGISCIGVVLMHCEFPYPYGKVIGKILAFAVPIFFMISGYFACYENKEIVRNNLIRKIKHILKLTIIAEIIYLIIYLLKKYFLHNDIELNLKIQDIIINIFTGTYFNGTLWFLYALLWSYVCLYFINKFNLYKISYKIAPTILIIHVIARTYIKTFSWYDVRIFRNFIFYGLPFV